jgi:hypothetical protein
MSAVLAGAGALVTQIALASLAERPLVLVRHTAAVGARRAVPAIDPDEGAVRVVRRKGLGHDRKEVQNAPAIQRCHQRRPGIAFAQRPVSDVGMDYVRVDVGRPGVDSFDPVSAAARRQLGPIEHNLKPSQRYPVQYDVLGQNRKLLGLQVEFRLLKLVLERRQIVEYLARRRRPWRPPLKRLFSRLKLPSALTRRPPKSCQHGALAVTPIAAACKLGKSLPAEAISPSDKREPGRLPGGAGPLRLTPDGGSDPP